MRRLIPFFGIGIGILLLFSVAGFVVYYLFDTSRELTDHIYEPLPSINQVHADLSRKDDLTAKQEVGLVEKRVMLQKPFTILVMGVDRWSGVQGRSDVWIVATVNPNSKSTSLMNIPRDTRTTIMGADIEDKVNHAYAYGGTAMAIASVEHLIGIPIDYYIKACKDESDLRRVESDECRLSKSV